MLRSGSDTWGFPKLGGTLFWGVPITRTKVFWGLYWGTPIQGNYHMDCKTRQPFCCLRMAGMARLWKAISQLTQEFQGWAPRMAGLEEHVASPPQGIEVFGTSLQEAPNLGNWAVNSTASC